jgi:hypothetical protein
MKSTAITIVVVALFITHSVVNCEDSSQHDTVRSVKDVHDVMEKRMGILSGKMEKLASSLQKTMERHRDRVLVLEKKMSRTFYVNGDRSTQAYLPHRTWLLPFLFISCALLFLFLYGYNRYRYLIRFDFGLLGRPAYKMT